MSEDDLKRNGPDGVEESAVSSGAGENAGAGNGVGGSGAGAVSGNDDAAAAAASPAGAGEAGTGTAQKPEAGAGEAGAAGDGQASDAQEADTEASGAEAGAGDAEAVAADPLSEAMATISTLEDQLKRAQASLYNTETEYTNYVRRSKQEAGAHRDSGTLKVIEALLPVLDDVELARQHGDLEGPTGLIAEKVEQILFSTFKVARFGAVGDEFDPEYHEALMNRSSAEATAQTIETLIQPGYTVADKVLRPARVGVVSPEE
ncbi:MULTISPECIES: nucleotide exchange factor GrpE [Actinotignum]|uniref:nucleotide exchange factor GrpE n=1 Tax=Actinotignum TaxID=1653174 RepID=UPI0025510325|nr:MULTISPECIES: nucleotide exchange factor GrpE [Actinotignum]MDE1536667.1 nucleotide exchange factor GrpE [Actinotignum schaalii]MDK7271879.1 nucleotide exchange factor GrpE [Actinotignum schaalii]MDY5145183.1 nucleotide exchange factor GrpE [Actinotignum timonense]